MAGFLSRYHPQMHPRMAECWKIKFIGSPIDHGNLDVLKEVQKSGS
jgi:hypothetical protein